MCGSGDLQDLTLLPTGTRRSGPALCPVAACGVRSTLYPVPSPPDEAAAPPAPVEHALSQWPHDADGWIGRALVTEVAKLLTSNPLEAPEQAQIPLAPTFLWGESGVLLDGLPVDRSLPGPEERR